MYVVHTGATRKEERQLRPTDRSGGNKESDNSYSSTANQSDTCGGPAHTVVSLSTRMKLDDDDNGYSILSERFTAEPCERRLMNVGKQ